MKPYHITPEIYEVMAESAHARPNMSWDCIELPDGYAVVFACRNGKPTDIEVMDEVDNALESDFDMKAFEKALSEMI